MERTFRRVNAGAQSKIADLQLTRTATDFSSERHGPVQLVYTISFIQLNFAHCRFSFCN